MGSEQTDTEVEEEPRQMGPEERLFRARQSWVVYVVFVVGVLAIAVTLILAAR